MRVLGQSLLLLSGALALAGCNQDKPSAQATAGGEILEGSASDAMLPLDTVRSQPPLAPRSTEGAKDKASDAPDAGASDAAASDAPPADAAKAEAPKPVPKPAGE